MKKIFTTVAALAFMGSVSFAQDAAKPEAKKPAHKKMEAAKADKMEAKGDKMEAKSEKKAVKPTAKKAAKASDAAAK